LFVETVTSGVARTRASAPTLRAHMKRGFSASNLSTGYD
jgi:hypothetical protein